MDSAGSQMRERRVVSKAGRPQRDHVHWGSLPVAWGGEGEWGARISR